MKKQSNPRPANAVKPPPPPAPPTAPLVSKEASPSHIANEWADMATNGLQWLKNINEGISTPKEAIAEMESNLKRIHELVPILEPIELPEGRDPRATAVYESDFRKSNPALHRLYVEWAVNDLMVINQSLARLYAVSRICMLGAAGALQAERDKLVATSAAWADADVLVRSVYKHLRKPYIG